MGGRVRIESFTFELESTGHPKISKGTNGGEISKAFSLSFPFTGENTRGIIVPSDPISRRDNSFPLNPKDVELSRYESHWTLQLRPLPPFSPINQFPQNFSLKRSCEKFHLEMLSGTGTREMRQWCKVSKTRPDERNIINCQYGSMD